MKELLAAAILIGACASAAPTDPVDLGNRVIVVASLVRRINATFDDVHELMRDQAIEERWLRDCEARIRELRRVSDVDVKL